MQAGEEEEEEGTDEVVVLAGEGGMEQEELEDKKKYTRQMMRERAVATGALNTGVNCSSAMAAQSSRAASLTP